MPENHQDIESLSAEIGRLADKVVTEVVGDRIDSPVGMVPRSIVASMLAQSESFVAHLRGDPEPVGLLEVPVIVRLVEEARPISEIVNLSVGNLLEFKKSADSELDLMINNKCIGRGRAVKVGEKLGLQLTEVEPVSSHI